VSSAKSAYGFQVHGALNGGGTRSSSLIASPGSRQLSTSPPLPAASSIQLHQLYVKLNELKVETALRDGPTSRAALMEQMESARRPRRWIRQRCGRERSKTWQKEWRNSWHGLSARNSRSYWQRFEEAAKERITVSANTFEATAAGKEGKSRDGRRFSKDWPDIPRLSRIGNGDLLADGD